MALMLVLGLLCLIGLAAALWWCNRPYVAWSPSDGGAAPRYLRNVAIALVGGFWAGALFTGPAVRLVMRLLAATAGDGAQGRITEAEEVVGEIDLEGTFGLYVFGGVLPGLLSGALYLLVRRLLPAGWLGGVAFGALHLVVAATRVDPLRTDNPDFDIVGPGWLAVATFGLTCIVHGMAVVAIANRFSAAFPPVEGRRVVTWLAVAPPVLLLIPGAVLLVPIVFGLLVAIAFSRLTPSPSASKRVVLAGRIAIGVLALVLLPGAALDLVDIAGRGP